MGGKIMEVSVGGSVAAQGVARALVDGFDQHYSLIRASSAQAKQRFEDGDWVGVQTAVRERIPYYDNRVVETVKRLHERFGAEVLNTSLWQQAKLFYIGLLVDHQQPELAETFFNSVCCRILHRTYFNNDFIFFRPAVSTEYIDAQLSTYRSYYPNDAGFRNSLRQVLLDFGWHTPYEDVERDLGYIYQTIERHVGHWPRREFDFQIQVLNSPFYRNKAAYIIGKAINDGVDYPFAIPVLHAESGLLYVDTILLETWRIRTLFSLSRAYFMVDMEVPSAYVHFLRSILPGKPRSELYTMLGLGKQGKTMFFRDLMFHLHHSLDNFIVAPGIAGLVMLVFTLPSYPYVFKLIRDKFGASKEVDHATVKSKYQLVKQVDRVGRMADTLEFSYAALPKARFSPDLLRQLHELVPSLIEEEGENLVIKHLYIERRMEPLNLYLTKVLEANRPDQMEQAVIEYGNAIRELAIANIFPGDMLWKNFGMTRLGRVLFYDYDELEFMTNCHFRRIPPAPNPDMEMSGEPWYSVARNDVFPEEFALFLLTSPQVREVFLKHHADLLDPGFWQKTQDAIRRGEIKDFFPYPRSLRFCCVYGRGCEYCGTDCDNSA